MSAIRRIETADVFVHFVQGNDIGFQDDHGLLEKIPYAGSPGTSLLKRSLLNIAAFRFHPPSRRESAVFSWDCSGRRPINACEPILISRKNGGRWNVQSPCRFSGQGQRSNRVRMNKAHRGAGGNDS